MSNQLATQRETFRANTEQTRQLHFLLVTLSAGMFTTSDTATLIEDLQKRNMHLLQINSAQGLAAGELDLNSLDLDQETFVALHRIQAESKDLWDQTAIPAAPAKAAHQVAHGTRHKRIRPGGKGSDQSSDSSHEDKPPAPTDTASSSMTATGLGDHQPAESSTQRQVVNRCSGRRRGIISKRLAPGHIRPLNRAPVQFFVQRALV
ncbi:hypothetical protein PC128_g21062 [Phytophthora cactorum]|nr:hypothetical protein PC128_g21062 [Phytophthora cactorum]